MEKEKSPGGARDTHVTQIRMPCNLADRAKKYTELTGVSFNSIICIALDIWLRDLEL